MEDVAVRLACLDAAVRCTGNPNHLTLAREFYAFATEGADTNTKATNTKKAK